MRKRPNHRADDQAVRHNGAGCRQNGLVAQLVSAVSRQQRRQRTEYNVENRRRRVEDVCNQAAHEQAGNRLRQHHRQHRERFGETELNRPIRDRREQQRQRGVERGDDGRETEGTGGQQLLKHRSTPFFAGLLIPVPALSERKSDALRCAVSAQGITISYFFLNRK